MSAAALPFGHVSFQRSVLPWATSAEDEQRFKRILRIALILALLLGIALPLIPLREKPRTEVQPLPPPLAKLLLDTKPLPPPTPAPQQPIPPTPEQQAKAEPVKPKPEAKPEPAPRDPRAPVPEARNPQPNKPPGEALDNARRVASGVGLLAMKNELQQIAAAPMAVQLRDDIKPGPGVGTGVGVGVGAGTEAGIPVRSMITSAAGKGSGGINVAAYSRDTGGGGLAGRSTTLVEGVAGGGGGGGYGGGGTGARGAGGKGGGGEAGGTLKKSGSGKASRSIEEIKIVFERHKGAIYALYNRALRDEPSLQGKVVVELTIAPDGNVTNIRLVSSELKAADLEGKLLARIRQFDFGAKDVEVMVVSWPVDFLPS